MANQMLTKPGTLGVALALAASAAHAADLPMQTRLGAIFAEPSQRVVIVEPESISPWVATSPRVPGYYGRAGDFDYRRYYGTSDTTIFGRFPYACPYYGYGRAC